MMATATGDLAAHLRAPVQSLVTVAALFEDGIRIINLRDYPANDKDQPDYLNISRFATPAQLLDLAKRRTQVKLLKKRGAK